MDLDKFNYLLEEYFSFLKKQDFVFVPAKNSFSARFTSTDFEVDIFFDEYRFELNLSVTRLSDSQKIDIEDIAFNNGNQNFRLFQCEDKSQLLIGLIRYAEIMKQFFQKSFSSELFSHHLNSNQQRLDHIKEDINYKFYADKANTYFKVGNFKESVQYFSKIFKKLNTVDKKKYEIALKKGTMREGDSPQTGTEERRMGEKKIGDSHQKGDGDG